MLFLPEHAIPGLWRRNLIMLITKTATEVDMFLKLNHCLRSQRKLLRRIDPTDPIESAPTRRCEMRFLYHLFISLQYDRHCLRYCATYTKSRYSKQLMMNKTIQER